MGRLRALWKKDAGFVVSSGVHLLALVFLLVNFSSAPKFDEAPVETVQVDMITTSDLNDITNGEKTAKLMPTPQRRVDKVAELEDPKPLPPTPEAKKDVPPLPSPDKANDDPGQADKAEPTAALPPPRPVEPVQPEPSVPTPPQRPIEKAEAPQPPPKPDDVKPPPPDAEAIAPTPPPRPKSPPKEAKEQPKPDPTPMPPARPPEKVAKVAPPTPPKRPDIKPDPKPKDMLDSVAKLLDKMNPLKPAAKARSGSEVKDARSHDDFSLDKISALLDHEAPQRKASTGHALTQVASLGLPTAHADKMSPSMAAQLDGWLIDHYRGCWSYFGLGATQDYVPQVRVQLGRDGSLIGQPALLNPPSDPNLRSLADSAIRAVNRCNPLEIPERFRPFYEQGYKQRTVRFDPKEMS